MYRVKDDALWSIQVMGIGLGWKWAVDMPRWSILSTLEWLGHQASQWSLSFGLQSKYSHYRGLAIQPLYRCHLVYIKLQIIAVLASERCCLFMFYCINFWLGWLSCNYWDIWAGVGGHDLLQSGLVNWKLGSI